MDDTRTHGLSNRWATGLQEHILVGNIIPDQDLSPYILDRKQRCIEAL